MDSRSFSSLILQGSEGYNLFLSSKRQMSCFLTLTKIRVPRPEFQIPRCQGKVRAVVVKMLNWSGEAPTRLISFKISNRAWASSLSLFGIRIPPIIRYLHSPYIRREWIQWSCPGSPRLVLARACLVVPFFINQTISLLSCRIDQSLVCRNQSINRLASPFTQKWLKESKQQVSNSIAYIEF